MPRKPKVQPEQTEPVKLSPAEIEYLTVHRNDPVDDLAIAIRSSPEVVREELAKLPPPGKVKMIRQKGSVSYTASQSMEDDGDGVVPGSASRTHGLSKEFMEKNGKDIFTWDPH